MNVYIVIYNSEYGGYKIVGACETEACAERLAKSERDQQASEFDDLDDEDWKPPRWSAPRGNVEDHWGKRWELGNDTLTIKRVPLTKDPGLKKKLLR